MILNPLTYANTKQNGLPAMTSTDLFEGPQYRTWLIVLPFLVREDNFMLISLKKYTRYAPVSVLPVPESCKLIGERCKFKSAFN